MKFFSKKKILITGATGFVGSHLTEALVEIGAKVTATTHHPLPLLSRSYFQTLNLDKKCRVVKIDLINFTDVRKLIRQLADDNHLDFIFHLAAQPLVDVAYDYPKTTLYSNILGTINILECARLSRGIKGIIIASSDKAYGKMAIKTPRGWQPRAKSRGMTPLTAKETKMNRKYTESDPLAGDHPYEVSKSSTDLIANSYFKTYQLPVVTTRFGNIYGEGDLHFSRLIPGLMKAVVNDEVFEIRSNGQFVRDYLYVKDVIRGYLLIAQNIEKVKGEAFNFGSNDTFSVIALIRLISQISQIGIKYKILNTQKNEIPYQSLNWSKIRKTLGWKPEYSLDSTIKKISTWYKSNLLK